MLTWCEGSSWIRQVKLRQKLNFWKMRPTLFPINSELEDLFSPFQKHCIYIMVNYPCAFCNVSCSSKADLKQFKGLCNPTLQEDDVPSAYHLSVVDTTVHHSCPPFLPGIISCSGTADALELPILFVYFFKKSGSVVI